MTKPTREEIEEFEQRHREFKEWSADYDHRMAESEAEGKRLDARLAASRAADVARQTREIEEKAAAEIAAITARTKSATDAIKGKST